MPARSDATQKGFLKIARLLDCELVKRSCRPAFMGASISSSGLRTCFFVDCQLIDFLD
jgi:hypothetical protein